MQPIQRWEYLRVSYDTTGLYANGKALTPQPDLYQYLDQLGNQGWEMVGIAYTASGTAVYVFKRPKS